MKQLRCQRQQTLGKFPTFRDDYVPEGSLILMARFSADDMAKWRSQDFYQALPDALRKGDLPILVIQTSRPKAKVLAQQLQKADGVIAVCFNPGRDPMTGERFHSRVDQDGGWGVSSLCGVLGGGPGGSAVGAAVAKVAQAAPGPLWGDGCQRGDWGFARETRH
jgi:hypothetical protein